MRSTSAIRLFNAVNRHMATLEKLNIDNLALRSLPIDKDERIISRSVPGACFSRVAPAAVDGPILVCHSQQALDLLDIHPDEVRRKDFAEYFSGNRIIPGAEPAAHCYCGHQFGSFSGQLGDGATMYLCEVVNRKGERWELQFKGAGKTPYSRHADGRKVLRSSIREFLCSEAIHFLGIPTTRAGTCVTSDTRVVRDIHYDGHPIEERATIITRIAPTFLRFGSFEIFKAQDPMTGRSGPSVGRTDILHQLLDYATSTFYPEIHSAHVNNREARTTEFFKEVCRRTAKLVALWQSVGFCHGVLNTDNMSIMGLTIDYGPFGFMDRYDPDHICNGSDNGGRYSYQKQPSICQWNLEKLAEALSPCMPSENVAEGIEIYKKDFEKIYLHKMRSKLGLKEELEEDSDLIESLLDTMHRTGCDFTNGFLCLNDVSIPDDKSNEKETEGVVNQLLKQCATAKEIAASSKPSAPIEHLKMLLQQNPLLLAAFGMDVEAIKQEIEKAKALEKLKEVTDEGKEATDRGEWMKWIAMYRNRLRKEIKDSSMTVSEINAQRLQLMKDNNPRYVLRNYIAQNAIEKAEKGDFSEVRRVLKLLESPYSETKLESVVGNGASNIIDAYCDRPPHWAYSLVVT